MFQKRFWALLRKLAENCTCALMLSESTTNVRNTWIISFHWNNGRSWKSLAHRAVWCWCQAVYILRLWTGVWRKVSMKSSPLKPSILSSGHRKLKGWDNYLVIVSMKEEVYIQSARVQNLKRSAITTTRMLTITKSFNGKAWKWKPRGYEAANYWALRSLVLAVSSQLTAAQDEWKWKLLEEVRVRWKQRVSCQVARVSSMRVDQHPSSLEVADVSQYSFII